MKGEDEAMAKHMRLRLEFNRGDGRWNQPYPYIEDGPFEFFLDPNQPNAIRVRAGESGFTQPFMQFDLDRLQLIHKLLVEARVDGKVAA